MSLTEKIQKGLKNLTKNLDKPIEFPDWAPAGLVLWMPGIIAELCEFVYTKQILAGLDGSVNPLMLQLPIFGAQIGGLIAADYECGEYAHKKGKGALDYISFTYSGEMN